MFLSPCYFRLMIGDCTKKDVTVMKKKEERVFADPLQMTYVTFVKRFCADKMKNGRLRVNANHSNLS